MQLQQEITSFPRAPIARKQFLHISRQKMTFNVSRNNRISCCQTIFLKFFRNSWFGTALGTFSLYSSTKVALFLAPQISFWKEWLLANKMKKMCSSMFFYISFWRSFYKVKNRNSLDYGSLHTDIFNFNIMAYDDFQFSFHILLLFKFKSSQRIHYI